MAREIRQLRVESAMSDAEFRAAWIVLCVQGLDDRLAGELNYFTGVVDGRRVGGVQQLYTIASPAHPALAERFHRSLGGGFLRHPDPYPPPR